jgi:hypothetical protein
MTERITTKQAPMPCEIESADFPSGTVTLRMTAPGWTVAFGQHWLCAANPDKPLDKVAVACDIKTLCANGELPDSFQQVADWVASGQMPGQPAPEPEYVQLRHIKEDGELSPWGAPIDPKERHSRWADGVEMRLLYTAPQPVPVHQPLAVLLKQSRENFERNFGKGGAGWADWIYSDIAELLSEPAAQPAPAQPLTAEQINQLVWEHIGPQAQADGKSSVYDAFLLAIRATEAAHGIGETK